MAYWLLCIFSGRHDYSMACENGAIFLRCPHCGRRSRGWQVSKTAAPDRRPAADRSPCGRRAPVAVRLMSVLTGE